MGEEYCPLTIVNERLIPLLDWFTPVLIDVYITL